MGRPRKFKIPSRDMSVVPELRELLKEEKKRMEELLGVDVQLTQAQRSLAKRVRKLSRKNDKFI